jgi:hypothetical protein
MQRCRCTSYARSSRGDSCHQKPTPLAVLLIQLGLPGITYCAFEDATTHSILLFEVLAAPRHVRRREFQRWKWPKLLCRFTACSFLQVCVVSFTVAAGKAPVEVIVSAASQQEKHLVT